MGPVAKTETDWLVPAATMAALAATSPVQESRVETLGRGDPVAEVVRKPSGPSGTAVTFMAYAVAMGGIWQEPRGMGKSLVWPANMDGPPNSPVGFRVSATRQGAAG